MKKIYEVIFQDEYDNLNQLGWYGDLDDAIDDINGCLEVYGDGKYQLKKGDLKEYPGTFGSCFDMGLAGFFSEDAKNEDEENKVYGDLQSASVRGFVQEVSDEEYDIFMNAFVNHTETDFEDFTLNYDNLITLIKKGENKAILEYIEKNKEQALYALSGSILEEYTKIMKGKTLIDLEEKGIKPEEIKSEEFWENFLSQMEGLEIRQLLFEPKEKYTIGYRVFMNEYYRYFIGEVNGEETLCFDHWLCYSEKPKKNSTCAYFVKSFIVS